MQPIVSDFEICELIASLSGILWTRLTSEQREDLERAWQQEVSNRTGPVFQQEQTWRGTLDGAASNDLRTWFVMRNIATSLDWARQRIAASAEGKSQTVETVAQDSLTRLFRRFLCEVAATDQESPQATAGPHRNN